MFVKAISETKCSSIVSTDAFFCYYTHKSSKVNDEPQTVAKRPPTYLLLTNVHIGLSSHPLLLLLVGQSLVAVDGELANDAVSSSHVLIVDELLVVFGAFNVAELALLLLMNSLMTVSYVVLQTMFE